MNVKTDSTLLQKKHFQGPLGNALSIETLLQWIEHLNNKNSVMFESDGLFIHLSNGSVLFKFKKQPFWRFKPSPSDKMVYELSLPTINDKLNEIFKKATHQQAQWA